MTLLRTSWLSLVLFACVGPIAQAAPAQSSRVQAELLAERTAIVPGQPFTVGLRMKMDDHWHIYWVNPGDSGLAPNIEWTLPPGFSAGPIHWPAPRRIPTPPLMTYGYEGEVLLMTEITPPANLPANSTVKITANADWLVCDKVCIPGRGEYPLELPVSGGGTPSSSNDAPLFERTRSSLPIVGGEELNSNFARSGDAFILTVELPKGTSVDPAKVYFYPLEGAIVDAAQPQTAHVAEGRLEVRMKRSPNAEGDPESLRGLLALDSTLPPPYGNRAIAIAAMKTNGISSANSPASPHKPSAAVVRRASGEARLAGEAVRRAAV